VIGRIELRQRGLERLYAVAELETVGLDKLAECRKYGGFFFGG
jgi:hypothetical protein